MIEFVSLAAGSKVKIFAKPYSAVTVSLMGQTFDRMREIGGPYYQCSDRFDKGLTRELLKKVHLVLWDQPGTGFLECISSGIPTMVLWSRLYCEEEDWCKPDFQQLEDVGIIHRTNQSLLTEYGHFAKSPTAWMKDPQRQKVVEEFSKKYALVDDKWWKTWRTYLSTLKTEAAHG
jgi:putative transferase (TIGR04331 family)